MFETFLINLTLYAYINFQKTFRSKIQLTVTTPFLLIQLAFHLKTNSQSIAW